jgi:hypothetical protein
LQLLREAEVESADEIHRCADLVEKSGYDVVHVDERSSTGVLLEAHQEKDTPTGDCIPFIIEVSGGEVAVSTPISDVREDSVAEACQKVCSDIHRMAFD